MEARKKEGKKKKGIHQKAQFVILPSFTYRHTKIKGTLLLFPGCPVMEVPL